MAAVFSPEAVDRRCREECAEDVAAVRNVVVEPRGHSLMIADVDGGPCLFCAVCGAYCTVKPRNLLEACPGRAGRQPAGLAALKRFRAGYAPSCGDLIGRKLHGVQPLHAAALDQWNQVPLARRSEVLARDASSRLADDDRAPPRVLSQTDVNVRVARLLEACRAGPIVEG